LFGLDIRIAKLAKVFSQLAQDDIFAVHRRLNGNIVHW
jgi:hypothetical protein